MRIRSTLCVGWYGRGAGHAAHGSGENSHGRVRVSATLWRSDELLDWRKMHARTSPARCARGLTQQTRAVLAVGTSPRVLKWARAAASGPRMRQELPVSWHRLGVAGVRIRRTSASAATKAASAQNVAPARAPRAAGCDAAPDRGARRISGITTARAPCPRAPSQGELGAWDARVLLMSHDVNFT